MKSQSWSVYSAQSFRKPEKVTDKLQGIEYFLSLTFKNQELQQNRFKKQIHHGQILKNPQHPMPPQKMTFLV